MAVGITSLDDWPMFTASLGWTGDRPPRTPRELLVGDAGDHLVGVHVRRGAAAGLEDVEHELVVVLALGHGLGRTDDGRAELGGEQAEIHVDLGRGLLDQAEGPDELAREPEPADLEVPLRRWVWAR